jgi:hypothetical protein
MYQIHFSQTTNLLNAVRVFIVLCMTGAPLQ